MEPQPEPLMHLTLTGGRNCSLSSNPAHLWYWLARGRVLPLMMPRLVQIVFAIPEKGPDALSALVCDSGGKQTLQGMGKESKPQISQLLCCSSWS